MKQRTMREKYRILRCLLNAVEERIGATVVITEGGKDPCKTDILGLAQGYYSAFGKCDRETLKRFFNMSLADLCKEANIDIGTFRPRKKLPVVE